MDRLVEMKIKDYVKRIKKLEQILKLQKNVLRFIKDFNSFPGEIVYDFDEFAELFELQKFSEFLNELKGEIETPYK